MNSYQGRVQNGVVVLAGGVSLPEGMSVHVHPVEPTESMDLKDQLLNWAGKGVEMPSDLARRHDHYLHGRED